MLGATLDSSTSEDLSAPFDEIFYGLSSAESLYLNSVHELYVFLDANGITEADFDIIYPALGYVEIEDMDPVLEGVGILKQDILDQYALI